MVRVIKFGNFVVLLIFVLLTAGCEINDVSEKLRWLDNKTGEVIDELGSERISTTTPGSDLKSASSTDQPSWWPIKKEESNKTDDDSEIINVSARDLTKEQKEKIDVWLEQNNYNRYGDSDGTYYTGGTPLFNEATGERIERFEYILEKHPNILNKI